MYSLLPNVILGFHGCDKKVADKILSGKDTLKPRKKEYDWLGSGIYFWENNPTRAFEYAKEIMGRSSSDVKDPAVVGAIIYPGKCLNLTESKSLSILKDGYKNLKEVSKKAEYPMPENKRSPMGGKDLLLRYLDRAVIEMVHSMNEEAETTAYDSVRGVFIEGKKIYPNAGIYDKTHVQICVRSSDCIKGYFRVMEK